MEIVSEDAGKGVKDNSSQNLRNVFHCDLYDDRVDSFKEVASRCFT